ncbi:GtrA family protein [Paenibacillus sp. 1001270B_150601_E10]|uniref:GtrA family protein n=1 Tax=Paenibacillus sp. 1001270B_150601_E10 TaxID=2787079 RepID=UPI00189DD2BC|nr:GtrA family protein [Paenibacillus sp. 1001270B_150601_E10]
MSKATTESLRSFIRFGLVGVVNTGVDFAVFSLLTWWQTPWLIAQIVAYSCGVLNSFLMNRTWTFKQEGPWNKGLIRFILLNVCTLGVTSLCILLLHEQFGLSMLVSKAAATVIGVLVNFAGSRWWVFREPSRTAEKQDMSHS